MPLQYPEHNDGSLGYLTFNARHHGCPNEIYEVDAVCMTGNTTMHGALVGAEVSETRNDTFNGDGDIDTKRT